MPSLLLEAVELRLGEKRTGQPQNFVGLTELLVLPLQGFHALPLIGGYAITPARIHFMSLDPVMQGEVVPRIRTSS